MQKDISGVGLKYARRLPIKSVMIRSCLIKEVAIQNVAQFKELGNLELWKVWVTRDGIKLLAEMPKLKSLILVKILMEDDWVKDITQSKSIEVLSLDTNEPRWAPRPRRCMLKISRDTNRLSRIP